MREFPMLRTEETEAARREICTTPLLYPAGEHTLAEDRPGATSMASPAGLQNRDECLVKVAKGPPKLSSLQFQTSSIPSSR